MEGLNKEVNENFSIIEKLNIKYKGLSMFPVGKIEKISPNYSGDTLAVEISGDVPTNF